MPPKKQLRGRGLISNIKDWIKKHPAITSGATLLGGVLIHDARQLMRGGRRRPIRRH